MIVIGLICVVIMLTALRKAVKSVKITAPAPNNAENSIKEQLVACCDLIGKVNANVGGIETQIQYVKDVIDRSLALNLMLLRERGNTEEQINEAITALQTSKTPEYKTYTQRFRINL